MKAYVGYYLMALAVLHTVVGLIFFADPLSDIISAGVVDGLQAEWDREAAVWFLLMGITLGLLGYALQWTYRQTGTLPTAVGWGILGMSAVGALIMPVSGFWLVMPVGLFALVRQAVAS